MNKEEILNIINEEKVNAIEEMGEGHEYNYYLGILTGLDKTINLIKNLELTNISTTLLSSGGLIVNTEYTDQAKAVMLTNVSGVEKIFIEPKTGRWIEDDEQIHVEKTYHCSECGCGIWGADEKSNYCPNCGAKMVKAETPEYPCISCCDPSERMAC